MAKYKLEYIWLDGYEPVRNLRSKTQLKDSKMDLVVAGTEAAVLMVESEALQLSEEIMLGGVVYGHTQSAIAINAIHELVREAGKPVWRSAGAARLTMRPLSDAFITTYLDAEGDAVLGCVGCYRIEALGAQLFSRIDGDQFVIRGLPLLAVLDYLRVRGVLAA